MSFTSITQRFVVWFLVISLLPILLIGYSLLHTFEKELQQTVAQQISAIADKKVDQIEVYLDERRNEVMVMTQSDTTRRAMMAFTQAFAQGGVESAAYHRLDASYRDYFKRFVTSAGYYDLFLISPQGTVVYSQTHEADFATNLFTGIYRNTGLANVASNALRTLESGVSEFESYAPSANAIAAFVAVPIMIQGKVVGALALQIDNARVFQVLLDNTGLGNSGETVVARLEDERTALVMAPLKSDPDAALKRKIPLGDQDRATPLVHAMNGERGSGLAIDYSGQPVVAAWRYLPVMRAGMVVKMDTAEALAPLYRVRNFSLAVLGLALFTAVIGAFLLGRRVVAPLKNLSNSAHDIAAGKLDQRVCVVGRDEMGQLADSFNTMAAQLQSSYANLEEQVEQRTVELTQALKQEQEAQGALRKEHDFVAGLVNTAPVIVLLLDTQGVIEYINPYFEQLTGYRLDEVKGKEWFRTFLPARDQEKIRALFQQTVHGVPARGNINPIVTRSGKELEIEWYDQAMHDAQGKVISVLATGQNVTARRSMELALSASAERLNEAQRIAQLGSWELDLLTGELIWSDEVFRLFEIDKSQFGATYEAFLEAIHPDDRDAVNQAYNRSLETRSPYEIIHRLCMRDGRIKWVRERCETIFDAEGKPLRSTGTVQDITSQQQAEQSLRESEARYHSVVSALSESIVLHAKDGEIIAANESAERILGLTADQMKGRTPTDPRWRAIHEDGTPFPGETHPASVTLRTGKPQSNIIMGVHKPDGALTWISINSQPIFQPGELLPSSVVTSFVDITERRLAEEHLRVAAVTFELHEAIMITDADAHIIRVNQAFQDITGYSAEEVLGKNPRILSSGHQDKAFYDNMWQQLLSAGSWKGEIWDRRKNGQIYPKWMTISAVKNEQGETTEYVAIFNDISARKQAEEEIRNLAFYDALTRLPNRRLLMDHFHLALSVSARSHNYGAVLFLDLDRFKTLNDTLGHDYGDLLLIEVAKRIQSCVREMDTVARLGGDEFVILIEEVDADAEVASQKIALIAEKIRFALVVPYMIRGRECHSSPSIGVCLYRGNDESVDDLLKHADMAMYQAKDAGRNAVKFFDPLMQQVVENRAALEADLRSAVSNRQMCLYYQIQVDNEDRPLGAEALIRWMHPQRGMVYPAQFIPVAEESALILEIGHWVLDTACRQLALWSKKIETRHLIIAINVSAQQFMQRDVVEKVAAALRAHHVEPSRLKLELTESLVLGDVADVVTKMYALKALGVGLSMDDFGTGYSSLSYLKQLPIDQIKIDQSFIRDIMTDPNDAVLVQTIIDMAQNFRLNVIAEGVETQAQLSFLKQNGCMAYQGYLFSKPVPIEEFEILLGEHL